MNKKLHYFLSISLVIHILLLSGFLLISFFKKKEFIQKKEAFIHFFDEPTKPQNEEFRPEEQPLQTQDYAVEPKTILYNEPIADSFSMAKADGPLTLNTSINPEIPTPIVEATNQTIEKPDPAKLSSTEQNESYDIQPEVIQDHNQQEMVTRQELSQDTEREPESLDAQNEDETSKQQNRTHLPELGTLAKQLPQKRQNKSSKKTGKKLSHDELKKLALQSLLKKEESQKNRLTPPKIELQEYLALKNAEQKAKSSVGYSVEATLNSDLINLGLSLYQKKFIDHLVTSYHIVRAKTSYAQKNISPYLTFSLETDAQGKILEFAIGQSCGDPDFDELFKKAVSYAVPFPVIPKHLQINRFRLGNIKINV